MQTVNTILSLAPGARVLTQEPMREPGATVTNMIYRRNWPSKLGGASIRRGAFIGDNTVH